MWRHPPAPLDDEELSSDDHLETNDLVAGPPKKHCLVECGDEGPAHQLSSDYLADQSYRLNTLANECLSIIVSHLGDAGDLLRLHAAGNTSLSLRLRRGVESIFLCRPPEGVNEQRGLECVVSKPYTNLRVLHFDNLDTYCSLFRWSSLPLTLVELVFMTDYCTQCVEPHHAGEMPTPIQLPNLVRLRLDCCPIKNYPIDVVASPHLTELALTIYVEDESRDWQRLLTKVPQLTCLRVDVEPLAYVVPSTKIVDCIALPLLTKLNLLNCLGTNIPASLEKIMLRSGKANRLAKMLETNSTPFTHLSSLTLCLNSYNSSVVLQQLSKMSVPLRTLCVSNPGIQAFSLNVWSVFPLLKQVNVALCPNPLFWPSIPDDAVFTHRHDTWQAQSWTTAYESLVATRGDDLAFAIRNMPPYSHLALFDPALQKPCGRKFLDALPTATLRQAQNMYILSSLSAARVIAASTSLTSVVADFCHYFIDFSNCKQLESVKLCSMEMPQDSFDSFAQSLQSLPPSITSLGCRPFVKATYTTASRSVNGGFVGFLPRSVIPFPVAQIVHLNSLYVLDTSFNLIGNTQMLPRSLQILEMTMIYLHNDALIEIDALMQSRPALKRIRVNGRRGRDDEPKVPLSVGEWNCKREHSKHDGSVVSHTWSRRYPE